ALTSAEKWVSWGRWPRLADEPRRWRGNSLGEPSKALEHRSLKGFPAPPVWATRPWNLSFSLSP
ncbi:MAG: hypothetical protein P8Z74_17005, partial [Acidobacteriota bacterium]